MAIKISPEIIGKKVRTLRYDPYLENNNPMHGGLIGTIVRYDEWGGSVCVDLGVPIPGIDGSTWSYMTEDLVGYNND